MKRFIILDYESRSEADLKKVGAVEYAKHSSTKILCAAWKSGTKEKLKSATTKCWSPVFPDVGLKQELLSYLEDESVQIISHNALFEQVVTRFILGVKNIPHERWICTAAMAAAVALPRSLEGACSALDLPIKKDLDGRRLMLKYSKPRKPTKNDERKWHCKTADLHRIMEYCRQDVDAETLLFLALPELTPTERKVWLLDQKINFRGFKADRELVDTTLKMIDIETKNLHAETQALGRGYFESVNQRAKVLEWLSTEGLFLPDLKAKTVSDAIKTGLARGAPKRMLEIRQAISKTSTAKYEAFEMRSRSDGRIRDIMVYHGASTGRWAGAGVQPQNFPRGNISDTTQAAEILRTGDIELVRLIYGDPMSAFSSCLRSVIVAPEGRELFCADYAAIEARVLFWVAKHAAGIRAYQENRPMYEEMAQVIYNLEDAGQVTKLQRQVGKQSVLGCGYGMGAKKFHATCKNFGIEIDESVALAAVTAYRTTHKPVVQLWSNIEKAAIAAVEVPGKKYRINYTTWWVDNDFLWCELPSGRRLAYHRPEIRYEPTPWGDKRPVLYHYGVNPVTRKWEPAGTYGGRLVENVVQAIARDFLAEAMLRIEAAGYEIVLSVHDEIVAEREIGKGSLKEFETLMTEAPETWGQDAPIRVEGWQGFRYKK